MRYEAWNQIKNITADEIVHALKRDGWSSDKSHGSALVFWHPVTHKRVSVHYHPQKTYGSNQLRELLNDIGWTEEDLKRLKLIK